MLLNALLEAHSCIRGFRSGAMTTENPFGVFGFYMDKAAALAVTIIDLLPEYNSISL